MKYYIIELLIVSALGFAILTTLNVIKNRPQTICPSHTRYDAILACQQLHATTERKDWSYKSCITELGASLNKGLSL
jgi:hypothetical protein